MSYVVLARKYRPQTFDDVVGQLPVSQTLLNAIGSGRVAHAYVFSGPRGVGKTTTARILAKCLNCEKGPTKNPCNQCDICQSINNNSSMDDVLEIDGASNRGIEQIRELRDSAKYAPARCRYRIFIIDEAHQISRDGFGALLKILEEPPTHVVFMLATTEVQKIPAAILSRCQRFSLRPITATLVLQHLKSVCAKESIKAEDQALAHIVRFVEGSLRDALSLLDQANVFCPNGITVQGIRELLGLLPQDIVVGLVDTIRQGEPAQALRHIHQLLRDGIDLNQLAKDLQDFYHRTLLAKAGVEDVFQLDNNIFAQQGTLHDFLTLERNIRLLARCLEELRRTEFPRATFESTILRLAQKTIDPIVLLKRLETLQKTGGDIPSPSIPRSSVAPQQKINQNEPRVSAFENKLPKPVSITSQEAKAESPVPSHPDLPQTAASTENPITEAVWTQVLEAVGGVKPQLLAPLKQAQWTVDGKMLTLKFQKAFHQDLANQFLPLLKEHLSKFSASQISVECQLVASEPAPVSRSAPSQLPSMVSGDPEYDQLPETAMTPDLLRARQHFPGTLKVERLT